METKDFQDLSNSYINGEQRGKLKDFLTSPPIHPNRKNLVISTPSETGTSYFRVLEPAFAMVRNFPEEYNIIYTENITPDHFLIADILIMHRADARHSKLIEVSKKWPKTKRRPLIIHDVDDNEFNLARNHSMREIWHAFEKDKHSLYAIQNSDEIMTTGKGLYNTFIRHNKNVSIFRNYFNWRLPQWNLWDKRREYQEKYKGKVVIGYCGLSSHQDDIRKLAKSWKVIHDKYPQAHFILSGIVKVDIMYTMKRNADGTIATQEEKITDPSQTYAGRIKEHFKEFDPSRIEYQESKNLEDYAEFYAQYDINCVFVEKNVFNQCKSDIKVVEGLHYENIPVFSNFGPYRELFMSLPAELQHNMIKCETELESEWVEKLSYWIEHLEEGKELAKKIKVITDDLADVDLHINKRLDYLNTVWEKHNDSEILKTSKYLKLNI